MAPSYGSIIRRALAAGLAAGALTAAYYLVVGEATIDAAIALEGGAGEGHDHGALFTRGEQVVGGVSAAIVYGLLLSVVFGTVLAATRHRLHLPSDLHRSALLALAGFVCTGLVPALKYPASPPGVGDPATVGERTVQHLTLVGAALALAVGVAILHRRLRGRFPAESALALSVVASTVGALALIGLWPDNPDVVPAGYPPTLLWDFRVQSLATIALLWSTLGLGLGWALTRLERRPAGPAPVAARPVGT